MFLNTVIKPSLTDALKPSATKANNISPISPSGPDVPRGLILRNSLIILKINISRVWFQHQIKHQCWDLGHVIKNAPIPATIGRKSSAFIALLNSGMFFKQIFQSKDNLGDVASVYTSCKKSLKAEKVSIWLGVVWQALTKFTHGWPA